MITNDKLMTSFKFLDSLCLQEKLAIVFEEALFKTNKNPKQKGLRTINKHRNLTPK